MITFTKWSLEQPYRDADIGTDVELAEARREYYGLMEQATLDHAENVRRILIQSTTDKLK
jgi:hypothetical protein